MTEEDRRGDREEGTDGEGGKNHCRFLTATSRALPYSLHG